LLPQLLPSIAGFFPDDDDHPHYRALCDETRRACRHYLAAWRPTKRRGRKPEVDRNELIIHLARTFQRCSTYRTKDACYLDQLYKFIALSLLVYGCFSPKADDHALPSRARLVRLLPTSLRRPRA
jgi:hypothetical protein